MSRSGIGAQLGIATEETYGTYKAPTRFLPIDSESLVLEREYVRNQGLRNGRFVQAQNLHRGTTRTVGGDFNTKLFDQGMGILLNQLHGNSATPTKVAEKSEEVYKQTHAIGLTDPYDKSLTIQVGRDDTGGTERAFSYVGCKIPSLSISVESQGEAALTVGVDGRDCDTGKELAAASYDADALPFTFQQWELKFAGSKITNARSASVNISIPYATDRFLLGSSGLKSQPIINGFAEITIDAEMEFAGMADYERFINETVVKAEFIGTGAEIGEEEEKHVVKFTAPAVKQVTSGPTVQGPDIITESISFEVVDNGTEAPLTVEILSTDSTL